LIVGAVSLVSILGSIEGEGSDVCAGVGCGFGSKAEGGEVFVGVTLLF